MPSMPLHNLRQAQQRQRATVPAHTKHTCTLVGGMYSNLVRVSLFSNEDVHTNRVFVAELTVSRVFLLFIPIASETPEKKPLPNFFQWEFSPESKTFAFNSQHGCKFPFANRWIHRNRKKSKCLECEKSKYQKIQELIKFICDQHTTHRKRNRKQKKKKILCVHKSQLEYYCCHRKVSVYIWCISVSLNERDQKDLLMCNI